MAKLDHHLHTSRHSPDSILDPGDLIAEAKLCGLDGVVITEHDFQWAADELAELQARAGDLIVLSGAEVSTREGHFLVYGLPHLKDAPAGIAVKDLIEVVRAHDAAIVAAHPFRWDQDFRSIVVACKAHFDGIELVSNNVSPTTRSKSQSLLAEFPMGTTGSSDGHDRETIGCYFTEFPGPVRTMADFVRAIRSRTGKPRSGKGKHQSCGPA